MKTISAAVALAMILLGFMASGSAMARPPGQGGYYGHGGSYGYRGSYGHGGYYGYRGGVRFSLGVGVGVPFGWYGYYPPPYSYYQSPYYGPAAAVPYTPPTYIEQPAPAPQAVPVPQGFWYYCAESNAYYPYVSQCESGWQRVSPTPPPG